MEKNVTFTRRYIIEVKFEGKPDIIAKLQASGDIAVTVDFGIESREYLESLDLKEWPDIGLNELTPTEW